MKAVLRLPLLAAALGLAALPAFAHHSFAADYDTSKPLTLRGQVTKVDWMNPHVQFYLDVKDETGKVAHWVFELGSPNALRRDGWTRYSLKPGDEIIVKGCQAKDNSKHGNATTILSSDGKTLLAGHNLISR